jgi:hypothetical protein
MLPAVHDREFVQTAPGSLSPVPAFPSQPAAGWEEETPTSDHKPANDLTMRAPIPKVAADDEHGTAARWITGGTAQSAQRAVVVEKQPLLVGGRGCWLDRLQYIAHRRLISTGFQIRWSIEPMER